ncbi:MAG: outer membrane homotrimeric porin [Desulfovibrionaceae bacterium]
MKRLVLIATMFVFVLGLAATASAAELTATGSWKIALGWVDNIDFTDGANGDDSEDDMILEQRVRTSFTFTANENLRGVLQIEIGTSQWGRPGNGADLAADDIAIEVKSAYINFVWPNTDVAVYAGVMGIALPGGPGGSPIFDEDVAGAIVSAPITDNISVLGAYMRLFGDVNDTQNDGEANVDNFLDAAALIVPMSFDGWSVTPYAAFVWSGDEFLSDTALLDGLGTSNSTAGDSGTGGTGVNITYAGLTFDVSLLDPITIAGAFHYGAMHGPWERTDRAGWLGEIAVGYNQPLLGDYGLYPELYFAYSSGEDGNATGGDLSGDESDAKSERLPQVAQSYAVGTFFFGNDWLDGEVIDSDNSMGFWTLGLFLKDISFVEGLTHTINVLYIKGTNDESIGTVASGALNGVAFGETLTEEDSIWEFDLNTKYQIYDELSAVVNLGYLKGDFDEDVWTEARDGDDEDASKIFMGIEYKF